MRGSRAKKLRVMAFGYVKNVLEKDPMEGENEYNQAMNRVDWEPQLDDNGHPLFDPDGHALLKPGKFPGTITSAFKWRVMYQAMKKRWMSRR